MSDIMYALINAKYICLAVGKYLYLSVGGGERAVMVQQFSEST